MPLNWQITEKQERFLNDLLIAQNSSDNAIKSVQQMQLVIKSFFDEYDSETISFIKRIKHLTETKNPKTVLKMIDEYLNSN